MIWIAVDLVGVPLGFATDYVPTSVLYIFYGLFVVYGFDNFVIAYVVLRGTVTAAR